MLRLRSGWIWPGLRAGLFAALVSGLILNLSLVVFFGHLFTSTYDYMLAPILFVSHLSLVFGCLGIAVGLFWSTVFRLARRRARRDDAHGLCMSSCIAGAAAVFAAAWVAFGLLPGKDASTAAGLVAVAAGAAALVWVLSRMIFRKLLVSLLPSSRGALALLILSAFGTVLGKSVRSEYMTELPESYVDAGGAEDTRDGRVPRGRAFAAPGEASTRLNLLLLTVDTLRADHLGCYGYPRGTSPVVDSLAAHGVLFNKAYAHRPKTSPNFASILTGTYPQRHGVRRTRQALPGSAYTLAEALSDSGYITCGVVTNGNLFPAFGFDQGFMSYLYGHSGAQEGTEIALDWLRVNAFRPFFLWVHHTDPHAPYKPPAPYNGLFAGDLQYGARPLEVTRGETLGGVHPKLFIEGPLDLDYYISQYDGEIAYTDYWIGKLLAGLRALGLERNTLVVFTSDHGESLGEHEYYFEHGLFPYDESARIPIVYSLPGGTGRGVAEDSVTESVDLMPTMLKLLGMDAPASCQGESLVGTVRSLTDTSATGAATGAAGGPVGKTAPSGRGASRRDGAARGGKSGTRSGGAPSGDLTGTAYIEAGYGHHTGQGYTFAMTDGRYKLVVRDIAWVVRPSNLKRLLYTLNALFEGAAAGDELYDLTKDPGELRNIIGASPEEAKRLREKLDEFLKVMKKEGTLPADAKRRAIDGETLRSLKALGYVN